MGSREKKPGFFPSSFFFLFFLLRIPHYLFSEISLSQLFTQPSRQALTRNKIRNDESQVAHFASDAIYGVIPLFVILYQFYKSLMEVYIYINAFLLPFFKYSKRPGGR